MKEICFVCSANECRSPMAEKIFSRLLKEQKIKGIKVWSAGLGATEGIEMALKAKRALKKIGIIAGRKKSVQLKKLKPNTLYITMEKAQRDYLNNDKVVDFGTLVGGEDVRDPYGENQEEYDRVCAQINFYCKMLFQKINKIL